MTDADSSDRCADDAQRARVEALGRRRAARVTTSGSPADKALPSPRPRRRHHVAGRSRVGVAAFSVATMLGLVGVMGLARPASSATPTAPGTGTTPSVRVPTPAPVAPAPSGPVAAAPPESLTARPRVHVTTPTTAAPVARTNGSH